MVAVGAEEVNWEEVTEEEDEVKGMDEVRQTILKTELQDLEIRMEMKYRTMVDNILVPWFQWKLEDEFLKTEVPTVVMYHTCFKHCEAEECGFHWNPKYMEPPHNMLFRSVVTDWDGIQKNINITGKNSYQMFTFAFVTWIACRKLSLVSSTNTCTWAITIFRV